uniref:Calcineurin-like phosphoesterase domain-containing protein n=1 Tax=Panagrolaimus davidi TaxID=227884 RepID=A0A914Q360_9BILA
MALILGIALTAQGYIATRMEPTVKHLNLLVQDLPPEFHGFTIAFVSDIHTGPTVGKAKVALIVQIINDLNPDIITVVGDLSDGYISYIGDRLKPLKNLKAKHGKFGVLGNHEYFYEKADDWIKFYQKELNLTMFINDGKVFERNGKKLCLAGLDDYYTEGARFIAILYVKKKCVQRHRMNTTKAIKNCSPKIPTIILAHQPKGAAKVLKDLSKLGRRADVILSGHTHGGQLVVVYPIGIALVDYFFGLYLHRESNTQIYVSSGVNYWGPPVKMWPTLCEIVKIKLLTKTVM